MSLYEPCDMSGHVSQAKRDYLPPPAGLHRPPVTFTLERSNAIGTRFSRQNFVAKRGEMTRTRWSMCDGRRSAPPPRTTNQTTFAMREGLRRGAPERASSERDRAGRAAAEAVCPAGGREGLRFQTTQKRAFGGAAGRRMPPPPARALTVTECNDVGTRLVTRRLGPDEIRRSHLPPGTWRDPSGAPPRTVARDAFARPDPGYAGRQRYAGSPVSFPHLTHCIVTGRRRVNMARASYEASCVHDRAHPGKPTRNVREPRGTYNIITGARIQ